MGTGIRNELLSVRFYKLSAAGFIMLFPVDLFLFFYDLFFIGNEEGVSGNV